VTILYRLNKSYSFNLTRR